ncbi:MAG: hypothetical protein IKU11_10950, partial [Clostridia bacterium]|nr:hypothetical protein [Clostridia bacterium]
MKIPLPVGVFSYYSNRFGALSIIFPNRGGKLKVENGKLKVGAGIARPNLEGGEAGTSAAELIDAAVGRGFTPAMGRLRHGGWEVVQSQVRRS